MELARFLLMVTCAEWLLIFRIWVAPGVLFGMFLAVAIRFAGYMYLPHFMGAGILIYVLAIAGIWHLKSLLFRRSSTARMMYETPTTGIPWLVIVARQPKLALALELCIVAGFIFFLHSTPLGIPVWSRATPQVQAWVYQNAQMIANLYAMAGFAGLMLWDLVHFSQRLPARSEMQQGLKYNVIRPNSHSTPRLPSVKDLVNQYQEER